jgi:threonine/homoserine/homoserine lactone efflux protein
MGQRSFPVLVYFVQGFLLGFPAAAQPGPFQAYLLAQTMKNGLRRTLPAALAPLLSDGPIILLVVLLLTQLPPALLRALQIAGALFLLYLGWRAIQTFRHADFGAQPSADASRQSVLEAALMNFLNPNPYIYWATVTGPILVTAWRQSPAQGLAFLLGFYGTLITGFVAVIALFGGARRLGPRVTRAMTLVSALVLVAFGLYQLTRGLLNL